MLVQERMTPDPIVVDENLTVLDAAQRMKEMKVRRFPVVRDGKLVGIVTDRDLRSSAPSQVISFDEQERQLLPELHKLFSSIKIKDIMSKKVITVNPEQSVVMAAHLMLEHRISGMPVVDAQGTLVGVITESDVFKILIGLSGIHLGRVTFGVEVEDRPGSIKEVADVIRQYEGRLASILTSYDRAAPQNRRVYIRIQDPLPKEFDALKTALEEKFHLLYVLEDAVETGTHSWSASNGSTNPD